MSTYYLCATCTHIWEDTLQQEEGGSANLYDLADEKRRVVARVHEDGPRNNFTVVESLRTEACFRQAARIDKLEHLTIDKENSDLPQW